MRRNNRNKINDFQSSALKLIEDVSAGKINIEEYLDESLKIAKKAGIPASEISIFLENHKELLQLKEPSSDLEVELNKFSDKYGELLDKNSNKDVFSFFEKTLYPRLEQVIANAFQRLKKDFLIGYNLESCKHIAENYPDKAIERIKFLDSIYSLFDEETLHCIKDALEILEHPSSPLKEKFKFLISEYNGLISFIILHQNFLLLNLIIHHPSSQYIENCMEHCDLSSSFVVIKYSSSGKKANLKDFQECELSPEGKLFGIAFKLFYVCGIHLSHLFYQKNSFCSLLAEGQDLSTYDYSLQNIFDLLTDKSNGLWEISIGLTFSPSVYSVQISPNNLAKLRLINPIYQRNDLKIAISDFRTTIKNHSKDLNDLGMILRDRTPRAVNSKKSTYSTRLNLLNNILHFHRNIKFPSYEFLSRPGTLYFELQKEAMLFQSAALNSQNHSATQAKADQFFDFLKSGFSRMQNFMREFSEEQLNYLVPDHNKKWVFSCLIGYLMESVAMYAYLFSSKEFKFNLNNQRLILGLAQRSLQTVEEVRLFFSKSIFKLEPQVRLMEFQTNQFQEGIDFSNHLTKTIFSFVLLNAERRERNGIEVFTGGTYEMNTLLQSYFKMLASQIKRLMINLDNDFIAQQNMKQVNDRVLSEKERNWIEAYEELILESEAHIKSTQELRNNLREERKKSREEKIRKAFQPKKAQSSSSSISKANNISSTSNIADEVIASILELRRTGNFEEARKASENAVNTTPIHQNNRLKILALIQLAYDCYDHAIRLSESLNEVLTVRLSDLNRIAYLKQRITKVPKLLESSLVYLESAKNDYIFIMSHNLKDSSMDGFFIEENFNALLTDLKQDVENLSKDFSQTCAIMRELHSEFKKSPRYKKGNIASPSEYSTLRTSIFKESIEIRKSIPKIEELESEFSNAKEFFNQEPDRIRSRFFVQICHPKKWFVSDVERIKNPKKYSFDDEILGRSKILNLTTIPIIIPQIRCKKSWSELFKVKLGINLDQEKAGL